MTKLNVFKYICTNVYIFISKCDTKSKINNEYKSYKLKGKVNMVEQRKFFFMKISRRRSLVVEINVFKLNG